MKTKSIRTRKLTVSPDIIFALIKTQAGSLSKAVLECVMNSMDAGATCVDIKMTTTKLTAYDDGRGFLSLQEIEDWFEVFGFAHITEATTRGVGQHGIGRAQLWNFCSTVWYTNTFSMDVDIKKFGLDYDLDDDCKYVKGLRIEGKFYEPLTTSDIFSCERELADLAKYCPIPVKFNGKLLTKSVSEQKWTHETDDVWILLSQSARAMTVYNQGIKVREFAAHTFGCGGIVISKPGVKLALNMARNDILVTECEVWKKIKPFLQSKSDEAVVRTKRLTEEQTGNLASRMIAADIPFEAGSSHKLFVDVTGGRHTLEEVYTRAAKCTGGTITYVSKTEAGPAAEESHKLGHCFVLDGKTLSRFDSATLTEMMEKLDALLCANERGHLVNNRSWTGEAATPKLKVVENWRDACKNIREGYREVPHKEWTKQEQAAVSSLRRCSYSLVQLMIASGATDPSTKIREVRVGLSDMADAWTDGESNIWINRSVLATFELGMAGISRMVALMAHEYLHEGPSTGSHVHDEDFYERLHQVMLFYPSNPRWSNSFGMTIGHLADCYVNEARKRGIPVKSKVIEAMDKIGAFVVVPE